MNDKISALMDGELSESEMQAAIKELRSQKDGQACWDQYHLVGDAMRKGLPAHLDLSFAERVSQAVAQENIPARSDLGPVTPVVHKHPFQKRIVGFAMAASVAMVAYVGFGMITVENQNTPLRVAAVVPTTELPLTKQVSSLDGLRTVDARGWGHGNSSVESRLNNYLYSHRNVASTAAMNNHMLSSSDPTMVLSNRGE